MRRRYNEHNTMDRIRAFSPRLDRSVPASLHRSPDPHHRVWTPSPGWLAKTVQGTLLERQIAVFLIAVVTAGLWLVPGAVQAQTPNVTIDDVYNSGRLEYVQITNRAPNTVAMGNWSIYSERGKQAYSFPLNYTLAPGATVKVHSGLAPVDAPPENLVWVRANVWNNQGDLAVLADANGAEIWTFQYGAWSSVRAARTRR